MEWTKLQTPDQLDQVVLLSHKIQCLIFKHSTRCSISTIAQHRLKGSWPWKNEEIIKFHLDVIEFREISNLVAERFNVRHESPQLLLIQKGVCIYHSSHMDITTEDLMAATLDPNLSS